MPVPANPIFPADSGRSDGSAVPGDAALRIAVVGHTNAGKTSLLRTLTRHVDFGEVSARPGTTRHVERIDLRIDGRIAVRFFDTPGLEDAVTLLAHVQTLQATQRAERIRRFLAGPEAQGAFEQEAKVLKAMFDVDAAFLVIDTRAPVLPKFRDEVELLSACGKPVMPVLNFVAHGGSREGEWRAMLADAGLHAIVRFDAAAPFTGAERELYQDLGTLLPGQRQALRAIATHLENEAQARRVAGCTLIAEGMVEIAALRRELPAEDATQSADAAPQPGDALITIDGDDHERAPQSLSPAMRAEIAALRRDVTDRAQRRLDGLLQLYGFRQDDAAEAPLPALSGRWEMDLFHPETLRQAGVRLGQGAAIGAAVGVVADLAVGGLSLGAGAALGGAIGGALAQGWGPLGRRLVNRLMGVQELSVEDPVLFVIGDWQLRLLIALERRGHGATTRMAQPDTVLAPDAAEALADAVKAAQAARGHGEWALTRSWFGGGGGDDRREAIEAVATHLRRAAGGALPIMDR